MNGEFNPRMSIYIPIVTTNTTEILIKRIFYNLNLGVVSRVDFVEKEQDETKYMAFVHFEHWFQNESSYYLQQRIFATGSSRVVYDDPRYWIIKENKNPCSKNELRLKRQVDEMKQRIKYLELVIGNHTRKFFDNGIITKSKRCDVCWVEYPREETDCPVCEYIENIDDIDDVDDVDDVAPDVAPDAAPDAAADGAYNVTFEDISNDIPTTKQPKFRFYRPDSWF